MTPSQLYQLFIAGKTLPTLSLRSARALLDLCRSKLVTKGGKLKPAPTDADGVKTALMDAHKELVGGPQVYAQTGDITAMALDLDDISARVKKLTAAGDPSPYLNALVQSQQSKPSPRPAPVAARPTAPAPRPTPAKPLTPPQSSAPKPMPQAPTSTTSTPSANDRRLAAALLDEQERREAAALVKTRAQFNLLKPAAAAAFCKAGGKIV